METPLRANCAVVTRSFRGGPAISNRLLRRKLKYDGSIRLEMEMDLVDGDERVLIGYTCPERHRLHYGGEDWEACRARAVTYNFLDRWYAVSAMYKADGEFMFYYCDIQTPAKLVGHNVECVDLDLDVVVRPDGTVRLLDEDEFALHQKQMAYPRELIERTQQAVEEVHEALARLDPPFDGSASAILGRSWAAQGPL